VWPLFFSRVSGSSNRKLSFFLFPHTSFSVLIKSSNRTADFWNPRQTSLYRNVHNLCANGVQTVINLAWQSVSVLYSYILVLHSSLTWTVGVQYSYQLTRVYHREKDRSWTYIYIYIYKQGIQLQYERYTYSAPTKVSIKVILWVTTIRFSSITSWNIFLLITFKLFAI